jgi:peroxiredoxin Q/BCP
MTRFRMALSGIAFAVLCSVALAEKESAQAVAVGKPAPGFKLKNQDDKDVTLADFKGKWVVLYFYPKDDTPGCTIQACDFSDSLNDLEKVNAAVVGVSGDSTESHRAFIKKHNLKITLLSDPKREMMKPYKAYVEAEKDGKVTGKVQRSTVIINPQGVVVYHFPQVTPKGHIVELKAKLAELQKDAK